MIPVAVFIFAAKELMSHIHILVGAKNTKKVPDLS